jgi:hypothetical protein
MTKKVSKGERKDKCITWLGGKVCMPDGLKVKEQTLTQSFDRTFKITGSEIVQETEPLLDKMSK